MSGIVDLIEAIEAAGWIVDSIGDGECVVRCPRQGCVHRCKVRSTSQVPKLRSTDADAFGFVPDSWNHVRKYLKERRMKYGLSITDVEGAAGFADGHLLKMEKRNPSRTPQFDTIKLWCDTLNVQIHLMPGLVSDQMKRAVADAEKRGILARRQTTFGNNRLRAYQPIPPTTRRRT